MEKAEEHVTKSEKLGKVFLSWDMMEEWVWGVLPDQWQPDPPGFFYPDHVDWNQTSLPHAATFESDILGPRADGDRSSFGTGDGLDDDKLSSLAYPSTRSSFDNSSSSVSGRSASPAPSHTSGHSSGRSYANGDVGGQIFVRGRNEHSLRSLSTGAYGRPKSTSNGPHFEQVRGYPLNSCASSKDFRTSRSFDFFTTRNTLPRIPVTRQRSLDKFNQAEAHVNPYAVYAKSVLEPDFSDGWLKPSATMSANPYPAQNEDYQPRVRRSSNHQPGDPGVSRSSVTKNALERPIGTTSPARSIFRCRTVTNEDVFAKRNVTVARNELEMLYRFGDTGGSPGQINSPHGFCLGRNGEIILADTMNHRIQIFDQKGMLVLNWGNARSGRASIWHPRKVAFLEDVGHLVVSDRWCEYSRLQIFTREGVFIRAIRRMRGSISVGLTVYGDKIVAVENSPSACYVVDQCGKTMNRFSLENVMREPSDVIVHEDLFYICDFWGHQVCVFNWNGQLLRRIGPGCPGIIFFPNGISLAEEGNIVVADTHGNRFHASVWSSTGRFLADYELPHMKVSRCCGLVVTSGGNLITAATNNNIVVVAKVRLCEGSLEALQPELLTF